MRNPQKYVLLAALGWTSLTLAGYGGTLKELERRTVDGKTTYLAAVIIDGEERETPVDDDGMVIRRWIVGKDDDR